MGEGVLQIWTSTLFGTKHIEFFANILFCRVKEGGSAATRKLYTMVGQKYLKGGIEEQTSIWEAKIY